MKKYSRETVLALSLIGAGIGYMLADRYDKGKLGTLGFMVGGLVVGFGVGSLITKSSEVKVVSETKTVESVDLPETAETETTTTEAMS